MRFARIALVLVASACMATPPETAPPPARDYMVALPADAVWTRLLVLLTDAGMPVENMERASWFMRSSEWRVPSAEAEGIMDCGKNLLGDSRALMAQGAYMRVTVLLRPAGDSTAIRMTAQPRALEAGVAIDCVSRGRLEARLLARLRG